MKHKQHIKSLIKDNDLKAALSSLTEGATFSKQHDLENNLILLSSRLGRNSKVKNQGAISDENFNLALNKIELALLNYLDEYKESPNFPLESEKQAQETSSDNQTKNMETNTKQPKKIFISYSHADVEFKNEFDKFFTVQIRNGEVELWDDQKISAGTEWKEAIINNLKSADIIVLLLSSDFFASDFIWNEELPIVDKLFQENQAKVVPILLRDCDWESTKYGKIQAVPTDPKTLKLKPIKNWDDKDSGWKIVLDKIKHILRDE